MESGKLIVVSGFSGVGKGTVIKRLMDKYPEEYAFSISATTRSPRPGEVNGREYYFVSPELFENMIKNDKLLEYTRYQTNYYGTPIEYTEKTLAAGKNVIFDIEVVGAMNIAKHDLPSVMVYMLPPTTEELIRRLRIRGSETSSQVLGRLEAALYECEYVDRYQVILINDDVDRTAEALRACAAGEEQSPEEREQMLKHVAKLKYDLQRYLAGAKK